MSILITECTNCGMHSRLYSGLCKTCVCHMINFEPCKKCKCVDHTMIWRDDVLLGYFCRGCRMITKRG